MLVVLFTVAVKYYIGIVQNIWLIILLSSIGLASRTSTYLIVGLHCDTPGFPYHLCIYNKLLILSSSILSQSKEDYSVPLSSRFKHNLSL